MKILVKSVNYTIQLGQYTKTVKQHYLRINIHLKFNRIEK